MTPAQVIELQGRADSVHTDKLDAFRPQEEQVARGHRSHLRAHPSEVIKAVDESGPPPATRMANFEDVAGAAMLAVAAEINRRIPVPAP